MKNELVLGGHEVAVVFGLNQKPRIYFSYESEESLRLPLTVVQATAVAAVALHLPQNIDLLQQLRQRIDEQLIKVEYKA
jgi:hypothetical protein